MKCECSDECTGTATHRGEWVDSDGAPSGKWTMLDLECGVQGHETGPGYRDLEPLRGAEESEADKTKRLEYARRYQ